MSDPESNHAFMRDRLKAAVHSVDPPPYLQARIRRRLHDAAPARSPWLARLAVASALFAVTTLGLGVLYRSGHMRYTVASQGAYLDDLIHQAGALMGVGLSDHILCAVFRVYPKDAPTKESMVKALGEYQGLLPVVRGKVLTDYEVSLGHQCIIRGRQYVHLSFRGETKTLSLMITKKQGAAESFDAQQMAPFLREGGVPIYKANAQQYQISAFETEGYLVYFVSDLSGDQNTRLMASLAPQVKDYLQRL